jgi:hypothetical protein
LCTHYSFLACTLKLDGLSVDNSGPAGHYDDDKDVRTTPSIEVVSKKKRRPDAFRSEYIRSGALMDKHK